jgi:hypothetical protein
LRGLSSDYENEEQFKALDLGNATGGSFGWTPYFSSNVSNLSYNGNWGGVLDSWHRVPDAGSTLGLLSFALGGLCFFRRNS